MVRLGLPKGRMAPDSARLCLALGVEIDGDVLSHRALTGDTAVSVYLLKAPDIARLLGKNMLDLGVTGDEWLMEAGISPDRRCFETGSYIAQVCLLMAEGDRRPIRAIRSVVTPFPKLARRALGEIAPYAEIMAVTGSSEALVPDIGDACLDVVETGQTAGLNGLVVRQAFEQVTTHLVRSVKCDPVAAAPVVELLAGAYAL